MYYKCTADCYTYILIYCRISGLMEIYNIILDAILYWMILRTSSHRSVSLPMLIAHTNGINIFYRIVPHLV